MKHAHTSFTVLFGRDAVQFQLHPLVPNHIRQRPDVTMLNEQMDVSQSSVVQNALRGVSFRFFVALATL